MNRPVFPPAALLLSVILLSSCGERVLQTGLSQADAQRMAVLLNERGIEASLEPEPAKSDGPPAFTVQVRGGQEVVVSAWRVLQEHGMPQAPVRGLGEIFAQPSMIPTAAEEKARLLVGLTGELTRTLKSLPGVVDARVHAVLPENSPLLDRQDWKPATASVLIQHLGPQVPLSREEVQRLVALGVEGLEPEQVAVVFSRIALSTAPIPPRWRPDNELVTITSLVVAVVGVSLSGFFGWHAWRLRRRLAAIEANAPDGRKGAAA